MSASKFVELTPDGTLLSTGYNIEFGGGAANPGTHHAALADALPNTTKVTGVPWTRIFDVSSVLGGDFRCTFGTYTLETTEPVERCRRVRWEAIADMRAARFRVGVGNGATTAEPLGRGEFRPLPNGVGKVQSVVGPWATKAQDGAGLANQEWTQTNINDLRARFTPVAAHFLGTAYFYKLRIKLDIAQKAEPFFITPSLEEVFPTRNPTLKWSAGSSDAQKKVEVKLFTADTAEDDAFNIVTATSQIYFFKGTTASTTHRVGTTTPGLQHGRRYYAFVRVATDFNGTDWWSNWSAGIAFKINAKPTVTVLGPIDPVIDTAKPVVTWDYNDEEGDLQSGARIIILEKLTLNWAGNIDPVQESLNGNAKYDSGLIATEAQDHELPVALTNLKNYRAYVQVRQRVPSVLDSDWAYREFNMNFAAPLVPTIQAQDAGTAVGLTVIPALSNLLDANSSSFESTVGTWTTGTNTTMARVNTQFLHGAWALEITRTTSSGSAEAYSDQTPNACTPCTPGQVISGMFWCKAAATPRSINASIEFINSSGSVVSTTTGTASNDSTTEWQKRFVTAVVPTSPAGIVKCRLRFQSSVSTGVGEVHYMDQAMIMAGSTSNFTPWDLGGGTLGATIGPLGSVRTKNRNWLTHQQASIESTIGGTGWSAWGANMVNTRSTTQAKEGTASLRIERTVSTGDTQHTLTANIGERIPTKYGDEWTFIASFRAGTTGRVCFINLVFRDIDNNILTNLPYLESGTNFATDNSSGWTQIKIRGTAPVGSYEMEVTVTAQAVPVGEFHYVDEMILYKGDTDAWTKGDAKSFAFSTGDHSMRVTTAQLDWLPESDIILAEVWDYENDRNCSIRLVLQTDGKIRYEWSTDGTDGLRKIATSTAAMSVVASGVKRTIRVDFDNDNGASGQNVSFFEGPDKNNASTAIGTNPVTVSTVNAPFNGFGQLALSGQGVGEGGWQGYAYDVTVYDDLVQSSDPAEAAFVYPAVTEFIDTGRNGGRVWEIVNGAEIEMKEEPNPDFFIIERSRDGGTTYEIFPYGMEALLSNVIPKNFESFVIRDEEVPLNRNIKYKVSAAYTGLGYDANSPFSSPVDVTVIGDLVTLKCRMDPTLNRHFVVTDDWLQFRRTRNRKIYQPIGRRNPIVLRGSGGADAFNISFILQNETDFDDMVELLNMPHTLIFVQTPKGSWWTELATDVNFRAFLWDTRRGLDDLWTVDIPFQEVDRLEASSVASH